MEDDLLNVLIERNNLHGSYLPTKFQVKIPGKTEIVYGANFFNHRVR